MIHVVTIVARYESQFRVSLKVRNEVLYLIFMNLDRERGYEEFSPMWLQIFAD
jgi:hypothetical protein